MYGIYPSIYLSIYLWDSRLEKKTLRNEYPGYDTKQSDGEASANQELWEMLSTHFLQSLPSPVWSGVVTRDRVLSMGQIELFGV